MSRPARRLDGRCLPGSPGGQRKVRAPREYGAGQPPAGATPGTVPQKTNRPRTVAARWPEGRARVKRCGKSAPRPWQQGRQGKPHREQDRIGAAGGVGRSPLRPVAAEAFPPRRPGWSREARRKARPRGMVVPFARGLLKRSTGGADRTRLTGRLAQLLPPALPQGRTRTIAIQQSLGHTQRYPQEQQANTSIRKDRSPRTTSTPMSPNVVAHVDCEFPGRCASNARRLLLRPMTGHGIPRFPMRGDVRAHDPLPRQSPEQT